MERMAASEPEPEREVREAPPDGGPAEASPAARSNASAEAAAPGQERAGQEASPEIAKEPPSEPGKIENATDEPAGGETADPRPSEERRPSFLERDDYRVKLPVFNGPLDLLLYLIKRDEVDIHDIPISHITEEYVKFLDLMREWNINNAGEFLLMAATLMEIKSRMLLPEPPPLEDDEEWEDPRSELVRQLMEYKRYKEAALDLAEMADVRARRFARPGERIKEEGPPLVLGINVWQLAEAFQGVLAATGDDPAHHVVMDETPQEVYMARMRRKVEAEGRVRFQDLFAGERTRQGLIGMFLALLELCRLLVVKAEQPEPLGDIWILFVRESERAIQVDPVRPGDDTFSYTEMEKRPGEAWPSDDEQEAVIAFRQDEIDQEIASVQVSDVHEHPPEPEAVVLAPQAPDPAHEARAASPGGEEDGEAAKAEAPAPPAEEGGTTVDGVGDAPEGEADEPPADETETATVPLDADPPDADATQETETVETTPEARAPRGEPKQGRSDPLPLGAVSVRFRWRGPFGLCPCRLSDWRKVVDLSETRLGFVSHRRMLKGMRLQLVMQAASLAETFGLVGRVETCERDQRGRYRVRVALAPFGSDPGRNSLEAKKALRRLLRDIGEEDRQAVP